MAQLSFSFEVLFTVGYCCLIAVSIRDSEFMTPLEVYQAKAGIHLFFLMTHSYHHSSIILHHVDLKILYWALAWLRLESLSMLSSR